jgi:hypothetical protein
VTLTERVAVVCTIMPKSVTTIRGEVSLLRKVSLVRTTHCCLENGMAANLHFAPPESDTTTSGCLYRKLCMDGARGAREKLTFSEAFGCGHVFGL